MTVTKPMFNDPRTVTGVDVAFDTERHLYFAPGGVMTNRELLEKAARAAGLELHWSVSGVPEIYNEDYTHRHPWRPLDDDGDALRLAESLGFTLCMNGSGTVSASDDYDKSVFATQSINECGGNRLAATRRAIVRAAATLCH